MEGMRELTDEQVKAIRNELVTLSWEGVDDFDAYQNAWRIVARILGVAEITNNGHGKVIWQR